VCIVFPPANRCHPFRMQIPSLSTWHSDYYFIADPILVEATGCAFQPPFLVLKRNSPQDLWIKADKMILSLPSLPLTLCPGRRVSGRHGLTSSNGTAGKLSMKSNNTYHIEVSHLCRCTGLVEGDRKNRNMHIMEGLRSTRASCTGVV
jgi:hypothetical protein